MTVPSRPDRRQQLAELRRQIRALDMSESGSPETSGKPPIGRSGETVRAGAGPAANSGAVANPGPARCGDAARCGDHPLELAPGLHEICPAGYLDTPAALAFQAGLATAD